MTKDRFKQITSVVIDKMEGGYYHPDMLKDGRVNDSRYNTSGETMFGLDRRQGAGIGTAAQQNKFWSIIDKAGARSKWKWNYMGGSLASSLKDALSDIMYTQYLKLSSIYFTNSTATAVAASDSLTFHFCYATWNGTGWFQRFATKINTAILAGQKNETALVDVALNSRINSGNSLIAQGGNKMKQFIFSVSTMLPPPFGVFALIGAGVLYFINKIFN